METSTNNKTGLMTCMSNLISQTSQAYKIYKVVQWLSVTATSINNNNGLMTCSSNQPSITCKVSITNKMDISHLEMVTFINNNQEEWLIWTFNISDQITILKLSCLLVETFTPLVLTVELISKRVRSLTSKTQLSTETLELLEMKAQSHSVVHLKSRTLKFTETLTLLEMKAQSNSVDQYLKSRILLFTET